MLVPMVSLGMHYCTVKFEVLPWLYLNAFLHSLYVGVGLIYTI